MEVEHQHLAVMFTDIKGYSLMMSEDEAAALRVLLEHNQIMESVISAHGGKIIKKLGDSYMVVFRHGDEAVKCGLHALTRITARNRKSDKAVEIRVGIHEGSMREREGDFFGETVNIAARLEQMGKPMTLTVTERIVQLVATRVKCEARFVGAEALKNLRYPVSVYQLIPADSWKLYLGADGAVASDDGADDLADCADAPEAWAQVGVLVEAGNLDAAARMTAAALSKFGGSYADYARLAAIYVIAGMPSEATSTLKMGEMLAQKEPEDAQFDWLSALAALPEGGWTSDQLSSCVPADDFTCDDLAVTLLHERVKARVSGNLDGLARLTQRHSDKALVLRGYAEALKDADRRADAHSMLEKTISVAPDVADHHLRRVQWMVEEDDLDAVLAESQTLAQRFPDDARVYGWTGRTRLLNLDPHGAQWVFEQRGESGPAAGDAARWLICSLLQQGRFDNGVQAARRQLRDAIRKNLQPVARQYLPPALMGMYLDRWDDLLELLKEYRRYDAQWLWPQAASIAVKCRHQLMPWERARAQLQELAAAGPTGEYPHPSAVTALTLMPAVQDLEHWKALHDVEFLKAHRNWIIETGCVEAAWLEARGALRFGVLDDWHGRLVPVLTRLSARLDPRVPALLAVAGLIEAGLDRFAEGKVHLERACKLWGRADWPVWEIQEAEAALAAGTSRQVQS